ncbi:MAG TPA: hypothetical protein VFY78_12415 [Gammaproteobacteria bacterium]|nr:hypothetical protein [Gammaproteobacteria bacterium]
MKNKAGLAIFLVVAISITHYAFLGYAGYAPTQESEKLMNISLAFVFAWWALEDAKNRNYYRPYEFGAFIIFGWPIVLPAYLVATRGWKGLLLFPGFIVCYYLPWSTGLAAYYLNTYMN